MAHSVVIKLNQAANEFQAGESIGFSVRGGVQYYDHKTKQKDWTNYSAVIFARAHGQVDFYRSALIEGAVVEVGGKTQKVDVYEGGQNGASYTIELQDAWLGMIHNSQQVNQAVQQPQGYAQQPAQQQSPQGYQQPQQGFTQQPQQSQSPQNAAYVQPMQQPQQGGFTQMPNFNQGQR